MALDVSQPFGGSMRGAAASVKAKVFVVVSKTDLTVTPGPAIDFAQLLNAKLLVLDDNCGHQAPGCESEDDCSCYRGVSLAALKDSSMRLSKRLPFRVVLNGSRS